MPRRLVGLIIGSVIAALPLAAVSQAFPAKPIRFIVPNPPGGGTDILSRAIATKMSEIPGWQVVVENRPGAGGNIGLDSAAKSQPDGYTIAMGETSNLAINPTLYSKLPYDPVKDFSPVVLIGSVPLVLVVATDKPYKVLADVLGAAKKGSLSFASSGNGTVGHLSAEILKKSAGIELLHVPYKGAAPAMTDLIGGQVDLYFASLPSALTQMKAGRLRPIAVTTAQRAPSLPDVPTIAESGIKDFDASAWYGIVAPAGTPASIVASLNQGITGILRQPDVRTRLENDGVDLRGGAPESFGSFIASERDKWAVAVKASGARVD